MIILLVAIAVACGLHRIWNYETVFQGVRTILARAHARLAKPSQGCLARMVIAPTGLLVRPVLYLLICPACNAVWISAIVATALFLADAAPLWLAVGFPFATYPLIRGLVWLYAQPLELMWQRAAPAPAVPVARVAPPAPPLPVPVPTATPAAGAAGGCSPCGQKAAATLQATHDFNRSFRQRVVLMTALADFDPSYSLVSVIFDQARALARDPTRLVQVWVMAGAHADRVPAGLSANVQVLPIIPDTVWKADVIDHAAASRIQQALLTNLLPLGNATIITHDLLLIDQYVTFAAAIHEVGKVQAFSWIHQIHSCVGARATVAVRSSLPPGHFLAVVDPTGVESAAVYYDCHMLRVLVIPNSRDIATWGATADAERVINVSGLLKADIAQVFPLSMPRAGSKGLDHVIRTHAALHRIGYSTSLVVADAHSTTEPVLKLRDDYVKMGRDFDVDVAFTSILLPTRAAVGVDAATTRALFAASNSFLFPSVSESSGLVALEALVSGNDVWVNSNVPALHRLAYAEGHATGIYEWDFPSPSAPETAVDYDALAKAMTAVELGKSERRHRRDVMQRLSVDALAFALTSALATVSPVR